MTNSSHALCVVDQKGKKVSRAKAMIAATFISLSGFAFMLPQQAVASCYGTGNARRCDGRTTYYRSGNPYKRQTYKTY